MCNQKPKRKKEEKELQSHSLATTRLYVYDISTRTPSRTHHFHFMRCFFLIRCSLVVFYQFGMCLGLHGNCKIRLSVSELCVLIRFCSLLQLTRFRVYFTLHTIRFFYLFFRLVSQTSSNSQLTANSKPNDCFRPATADILVVLCHLFNCFMYVNDANWCVAVVLFFLALFFALIRSFYIFFSSCYVSNAVCI